MTGFTAFSSNSTTQQKFLQILNECKLLAADKRKLESETVDQKATLDQLRAKVWALEQKIKELTVQNDVFLRKNAGANIEGDTLEFYKSEYIKALADAKRLEISQKGHVERTVELQKQVDHSNQTIAEIRTKLESLETIRLETVEELNVIDYLYQKISEFLKNVAISTQIAALRQRGKYSDDRVLDWMNEKLDPQLEQLEQPGAVASLMKLIVDNLAPLIRPSAMDLDAATVKVFNAAAGWYKTSDIAHVSRLIAQIEEGDALSESVHSTSDLDLAIALSASSQRNSLSGAPIDVAPTGPSEADAEFRDAAHLLKYLSGLFNSDGSDQKKTGGFPDEPFEILAHFGDGQKQFYEMLNQLKLNIKQLLDQNQIDVQESTFADFLTVARSSLSVRGSIDWARQSLLSQPDLVSENARLAHENAQLRSQLEAAGVTPYQVSQSPGDSPGKALPLVTLGYRWQGPNWQNYYRPDMFPDEKMRSPTIADDLAIQNQIEERALAHQQKVDELMRQIQESSYETSAYLQSISEGEAVADKRSRQQYEADLPESINGETSGSPKKARHDGSVAIFETLEGLLVQAEGELGGQLQSNQESASNSLAQLTRRGGKLVRPASVSNPGKSEAWMVHQSNPRRSTRSSSSLTDPEVSAQTRSSLQNGKAKTPVRPSNGSIGSTSQTPVLRRNSVQKGAMSKPTPGSLNGKGKK